MTGEDPRRFFVCPLVVLFLLLAGTASSSDYASGFYTRGLETARFLDTGDPVFDPYFIPVRRVVSVVPRVTLVATRDDNIFLASSDTEAATIVDLVPGILVIYGRPESRHLYADYGVMFRVYDSSDRLDTEPSHYVMIGGVYPTARSRLDGRAGYRRLENVDTVAGARIRKEDYTLQAQYAYRVSVKTSVGLLGQWERHLFLESRYIDYERLYGAGRLYYHVSPRSALFLQGGAGRDDRRATRGTRGDATFRDLSLGAQGQPTPKTSVSGRGGYQWRRMKGEPDRDVEHWVASLYGDVNPFGFMVFWSEVTADWRPFIVDRDYYTIDQRWAVGARRRILTDRLRGQGSVYTGRVDYRGLRAGATAADDVLFDGRRDDYWGLSLGFDWWTRENLSLGLAYSYIERRALRGNEEALREAESYESGRWTLRASWNF